MRSLRRLAEAKRRELERSLRDRADKAETIVSSINEILDRQRVENPGSVEAAEMSSYKRRALEIEAHFNELPRDRLLQSLTECGLKMDTVPDPIASVMSTSSDEFKAAAIDALRSEKDGDRYEELARAISLVLFYAHQRKYGEFVGKAPR